MDTDTPKKHKPDVRLLTLKRWNFPQTTSMYHILKKYGDTIGEYVSFQNHHFVSITKAHITNSNPISSVYDSLIQMRNAQCKSGEHDVHLVQSITLLGESSSFWEISSDILYITFIQLSNHSKLDSDEIKASISQIINSKTSHIEHNTSISWSLYHSLDFSDLILFTKNISYKIYHDILWELAIIRNKDLTVVRDTFTIHCFSRDFIVHSFDNIISGKSVIWDDSASLSIRLSIQSLSTLKELEKNLKNLHIEYTPLLTTGRYDISITTPILHGEKILQVLSVFDSLCQKTSDTGFGGYEISINAPWSTEYSTTDKSKDATQDREFEEYAGKVMDQLCERYYYENTLSAGYVDETIRSLKALLKNGFSEEFVLSVLLSFVSFLRISLKARSYLFTPELAQSLDAMTRSYFNALNTLALCTMHSERQFVQAPSFNATYFDVPPKLLAFYSAISMEIAKTLRSKEDAHYRFIITPDFRQDINVIPLELTLDDNLPEHLAVVYLCEKYFYNPSNAIKLLCHETGHYVGCRHREERAKFIFHTISLTLLSLTPLSSTVSSISTVYSGNSILDLLASTLAEYMLRLFIQYNNRPTRGLQFQLRDIGDFLRCYEYGLELFENIDDKENIISEWRKILLQHVTSSDICRKEFRQCLEYIQSTLNTDYLTQTFDNDNTAIQVYDVLARKIAYYAHNIKIAMDEQQAEKRESINTPTANTSVACSIYENKTAYPSFCETVIQSFSEAYADLRMIEVIGSSFRLEEYEDLLNQIGNEDDLQQSIRHDAVLNIVAPNEKWSRRIVSISPDSKEYAYYCIHSFAINQITQYLSLCHKDQKVSQVVVEALEAFDSNDVSKQCKIIRARIMNYRDELIEYCKESLGNPPQTTNI